MVGCGVAASDSLAKPIRSIGGFFAMALDTFVAMFKPPFAWREFILQSWFVARVSIVPTLMLAIPFTVLLVFTFNSISLAFDLVDAAKWLGGRREVLGLDRA